MPEMPQMTPHVTTDTDDVVAPRGSAPGATGSDIDVPPMRTRLSVVFAVVVLVGIFVLAVGVRAGADQARPSVAGTATIQPGETLWDVAVDESPEGTDPRAYLARIRRINSDVEPGAVRPWTVVLLPAP